MKTLNPSRHRCWVTVTHGSRGGARVWIAAHDPEASPWTVAVETRATMPPEDREVIDMLLAEGLISDRPPTWDCSIAIAWTRERAGWYTSPAGSVCKERADQAWADAPPGWYYYPIGGHHPEGPFPTLAAAQAAVPPLVPRGRDNG